MKKLLDISRLGLIIEREYRSMVINKTFIILSLLMPLLMLAVVFLPTLLHSLGSGGHEHVAVVDQTGHYFQALEPNDEFDFEDISAIGCEGMQAFYHSSDENYAVVVIPSDIDSTLRVNIYSDSPVRQGLSDRVAECLEEAVGQRRIESYHIPALKEMIDNSRVKIDVGSLQWSHEGEVKDSSVEMAIIIGLILALFSYIFVLVYGALVMSRVLEEKTNRIVEVIVSSCRPIELMLGKIIGVGLAGLTQIGIWVVIGVAISLALASGIGLEAATTGTLDPTTLASATTEIPAIGLEKVIALALDVDYPLILGCFVLYFVGGYLLYASIFAGLGSLVDQQSDASMLMTPVMLLLIVALMVGMGCVENPDGGLAFWCSMVPFTSPIVMMIRLPYGVAWWEIVASLSILFLTALAFTALSSRIYRTGILIYGSKPSLASLIRWLK